jgi:hypothetical protein
MILYINGDSHTAAAEAVNPYAFAEDDPTLTHLGRVAHPANLAVSWGRLLSLTLKAGFHCSAESASSNTRILRTTRDWLHQQVTYDDMLVIIQWSTWEREEWLYDGVYYQVGASGTDGVPAEAAERYRHYIVSVDWKQKTQEAHDEIWKFHQELNDQGVRHIFFNGNNDFGRIADRQDWGANYIGPYDSKLTYDAIIRAGGIDTVAPNSWHFGRDGHSYFHRFLLNYIMSNRFI